MHGSSGDEKVSWNIHVCKDAVGSTKRSGFSRKFLDFQSEGKAISSVFAWHNKSVWKPCRVSTHVSAPTSLLQKWARNGWKIPFRVNWYLPRSILFYACKQVHIEKSRLYTCSATSPSLQAVLQSPSPQAENHILHDYTCMRVYEWSDRVIGLWW